MLKLDQTYLLSASDMTGHLGCRHLTELNRAVADGALGAPPIYKDPMMDALKERGLRHEAAFVEKLKATGANVAIIEGVGVNAAAVEATLAAMQAGTNIIVQAALQSGQWNGRADILRRVERVSKLGAWSYEPLDTKLARETTGAAVLQLCLYADLIAAVQGLRPEYAYVVSPGEDGGFNEQPYRVDAYAAFYRRVKQELIATVSKPAQDIYPEPQSHCDICRWFERCDERRRADDHLTFVAELGKSHVAELRAQSLPTLTAFADAPTPLTWKPSRGAIETFHSLKRQAEIQLKGRRQNAPVYELIEHRPGLGLARLPEPSAGDVFFDLEGDQYVSGGGLEYLFGYVFADENGQLGYKSEWATTRAEEKFAFENFIDFVTAQISTYPDMHVYHYGAYEQSALKRMMGRYATREDELDGLLRSDRFVDLLSVVKNGVRASVESYSIKKLEAFSGYVRQQALKDANKALARVQAALELDKSLDGNDADRDVVQRYNEDDCRSTAALRNWLEARRTELAASGATVERPIPNPPTPPEALSARMAAVQALADQLTADVPIDVAERNAEQQARWLMAQCLSWHRREDKAVWWEFFRLADLSPEDLVDERAGLSGLVFESVVEAGQTPVHRYRFPHQDCEVREGSKLKAVGGDGFGAVKAMSAAELWVDIKKMRATAATHPVAVFEFDHVGTDVLADALMRVGGGILQNGLAGDGKYAAAADLLMRRAPQPCSGIKALEGETPSVTAKRIIEGLDAGVIPIQGPPGAGKTFTAAQMIVSLVAAGQTVGVTATSHKVIGHVLEKAIDAGTDAGVQVSCLHKVSEVPATVKPALRYEKDNAKALAAIGQTAEVIGATAWFWARPDAEAAVDVLFVDEAAQMSLANVLAVSQAAKRIVLLGDPRQLEQPSKGAHPEGSDASALDHILAGAKTIDPDQGLFLPETWRLHPAICTFTSELFYEERLEPRSNLGAQRVTSNGALSGAGLRYLPVAHNGNQNTAPEEVEAIAALVENTISVGATWTDAAGFERAIGQDDILIVAPYNAQVFALQQRLPNARIGTVDKFQGQEAPMVIYSMTSSSSADAPRGMEFLYSLNRLNVATSRAKCLCVLVAAPALFEADCHSPRQMELANALCRYKELAQTLD